VEVERRSSGGQVGMKLKYANSAAAGGAEEAMGIFGNKGWKGRKNWSVPPSGDVLTNGVYVSSVCPSTGDGYVTFGHKSWTHMKFEDTKC